MRFFIKEISIFMTVMVYSVTADDELTDSYNPLQNMGYQPIESWNMFNPAGPLSAAVRDYLNSDNWCARVVVFMANNKPLELTITSCLSPKCVMGMFLIGNELYYYRNIKVKEEGNGKYAVISRQYNEEGQFYCIKSTHELEKKSTEDGDRSKDEAYLNTEDEDCKDLTERNKIKMLFTDSYNPLQGDHQPIGSWIKFNPKGPLSADVRDFINSDNMCARVVVFMAKNEHLDLTTTGCLSPNSLMGMFLIGNELYYFRNIKVKEEGNGKYAVISRQYNEKGQFYCKKRTYELDKNIEEADLTTKDEDCKDLTERDKIKMLLLSKDSDMTGHEIETVYSIYNTWEPLGVYLQDNTIYRQCFRLLVFTSYGRIVSEVKVTCGVVQGLVMLKDALYYGKAAMIKPEADMKTFTLLLNTNDGDCVKRTVTLTPKDGSKVTKEVTSSESIIDSTTSQECKDLIDGNHLKDDGSDTFEDDPELQNTIDGYTPETEWTDVNTNQVLGIKTRIYYNVNEECQRVVLVTARGMVITGITIKNCDWIRNLIVRGDSLYYSTAVKVVHDNSADTFTVLLNYGDKCSRTSYKLKNEAGKLSKEVTVPETFVEPEEDTECDALMKEENLKHPEASAYHS